MSGLVLSLFPGLDVLGAGFEAEGFCVVQARDWIMGGDVRTFRPPAGRFDGVIGGDPCQSHSALANLVRAKGLEPSFPDLSGEYQRVIEEARPAWFLRENVPRATDVKPAGYEVRSFLLDHSTLDRGDGTGHEQMRRRRFWFGMRDRIAPDLRRWISFALHVLPDEDRALTVNTAHDDLDGAEKIEKRRQSVCADPGAVPVALGGSGKRKASASCDGRQGHRIPDGTGQFRRQAATGRHVGEIRSHGGENAPRYSLDEMLELQGIPPEMLERAPFTMQAKRKLVGNAVPLPMARALARAVREALHDKGEAR